MEKLGVSIAWLEPGAESFAFHAHMVEEEWMYMLSGRATVDMADESVEVGPETSLAFPRREWRTWSAIRSRRNAAISWEGRSGYRSTSSTIRGWGSSTSSSASRGSDGLPPGGRRGISLRSAG